jgi:TonB family protein
MIILALALALQDASLSIATKPEPTGQPQSWITDDDYPSRALAQDESGPVGFALVIDPNGKVTNCHVVETSGFVDLDQVVCPLLEKRAMFKPARDGAGAAITAVYHGTFTWKLPGEAGKKLAARRPAQLDLSVSLERLPQSYGRPALVRVHFAQAGKADSCRAELTSGNAALDKIACEQAIAQATAPEARVDGLRPDTRMVSVTFEAPAAK